MNKISYYSQKSLMLLRLRYLEMCPVVNVNGILLKINTKQNSFFVPEIRLY